MEALILQSDYVEKYYNCSGRTYEEWAALGRPNALLGFVYFSTGIFYMACLVPFMFVFAKSNLTTYSCYKIMFVLGIYDGMTIPIGSFYGGYATAIGMVYCMAPNVNYILGNLGLGGWAGASSLCMLLALNRCIDMIDPKLGSKLFDGKKTYLWISIPVIYSLYYVFFHTTVVFNSNLCAFFFDPFLGVPERNGTIDNEHYPHTVHSLHNMLVVVVLLVCYVVLCIILSIKAQMSSTVKVSKMQRQTFIQSLLVCAATFIAASVYVYMQFFPTPVWIVITGELCWQMSHGAAGISYAFLNKTMRNEAKRIFCGTTRSSTVKNITESQSQLQF